MASTFQRLNQRRRDAAAQEAMHFLQEYQGLKEKKLYYKGIMHLRREYSQVTAVLKTF